MSNPRHTIVMDIETIPIDVEKIDQLLPAPPGENPDEWQQKQYDLSSLNPTWGRICCIGTLDVQRNRRIAFFGDDEARIIRGFWNLMARNPEPPLITWNGKAFDVPWLFVRSVIHGIKPTVYLPNYLQRYKNDPHYDGRLVWADYDVRKPGAKLSQVLAALGLEGKLESGSSVAKMWSNGEYYRVAEYCLDDAYKTWLVYNRMTFQSVDPIFTGDTTFNCTEPHTDWVSE